MSLRYLWNRRQSGAFRSPYPSLQETETARKLPCSFPAASLHDLKPKIEAASAAGSHRNTFDELSVLMFLTRMSFWVGAQSEHAGEVVSFLVEDGGEPRSSPLAEPFRFRNSVRIGQSFPPTPQPVKIMTKKQMLNDVYQNATRM